MSPEEIQSKAEKEITLEKLCSDWTISSDPEEQKKAIRNLFELGATHVAARVASPDQERVIDYFGKRVLTRLAIISLFQSEV